MFTESDRIVLEAFYEATGGSRWRNSRGWMSAAPLNEWEGVTVDASGRVTKLLLEAINLSGITILTSSDASYCMYECREYSSRVISAE